MGVPLTPPVMNAHPGPLQTCPEWFNAIGARVSFDVLLCAVTDGLTLQG